MNITQTDYNFFMGNYKAGNYPKEVVNEAVSQLSKMSIALNQYKEDAADQDYINTLMAVDINNIKDKYTRYAQVTNCPTAQLLCSLITIDLQRALNNQNFDLNNLLK